MRCLGRILHMSASIDDVETIEFSQELVEKRHMEICNTGGVPPRKYSTEEAEFPEGNASNHEAA